MLWAEAGVLRAPRDLSEGPRAVQRAAAARTSLAPVRRCSWPGRSSRLLARARLRAGAGRADRRRLLFGLNDAPAVPRGPGAGARPSSRPGGDGAATRHPVAVRGAVARGRGTGATRPRDRVGRRPGPGRHRRDQHAAPWASKYTFLTQCFAEPVTRSSVAGLRLPSTSTTLAASRGSLRSATRARCDRGLERAQPGRIQLAARGRAGVLRRGAAGRQRRRRRRSARPPVISGGIGPLDLSEARGLAPGRGVPRADVPRGSARRDGRDRRAPLSRRRPDPTIPDGAAFA